MGGTGKLKKLGIRVVPRAARRAQVARRGEVPVWWRTGGESSGLADKQVVAGGGGGGGGAAEEGGTGSRQPADAIIIDGSQFFYMTGPDHGKASFGQLFQHVADVVRRAFSEFGVASPSTATVVFAVDDAPRVPPWKVAKTGNRTTAAKHAAGEAGCAAVEANIARMREMLQMYVAPGVTYEFMETLHGRAVVVEQANAQAVWILQLRQPGFQAALADAIAMYLHGCLVLAPDQVFYTDIRGKVLRRQTGPTGTFTEAVPDAPSAKVGEVDLKAVAWISYLAPVIAASRPGGQLPTFFVVSTDADVCAIILLNYGRWRHPDGSLTASIFWDYNLREGEVLDMGALVIGLFDGALCGVMGDNKGLVGWAAVSQFVLLFLLCGTDWTTSIPQAGWERLLAAHVAGSTGMRGAPTPMFTHVYFERKEGGEAQPPRLQLAPSAAGEMWEWLKRFLPGAVHTALRRVEAAGKPFCPGPFFKRIAWTLEYWGSGGKWCMEDGPVNGWGRDDGGMWRLEEEMSRATIRGGDEDQECASNE